MDYSIKDLSKKHDNLEQQLRETTQKAYDYVMTDPMGSLNKARTVAESICRYVVTENKLKDWQNPKLDLDKMLEDLRTPKGREVMPRVYEVHATTLQKWGNYGSHPNEELGSKDILSAMLALKCLTDWFCELKGFDLIPLSGSFAEALLSGRSEDALKTIVVPMDSVKFIAEVKKDPKSIQSVGMMFHAGAEWRNDTEKVRLINYMSEHKIPLRIIVNNAATVNNICPHMHMENKEYIGFRRNIRNWRRAQRRGKGFVQVRVSTIPMLHRIYIIRYKNFEGAVNVKYYTYGNNIPDMDYRACFSSEAHEYNLYEREFDYLWEKAIPIKQFSIFKPIALLKHFLKNMK